MKFLKTMPILLLAAFLATACGKKNDSGSGSGTTSGITSGFGTGTDGFPTATGTQFTTIEQLRTHVAAQSMSIPQGTLLIRGAGGFGSNYDLEEVSSSDQNSVSLREILYFAGENSTNHQYGTTRTLSRTATIYNDMLMLNNSDCDETVLTPVTISIQNASTNAYSSIVGTRVSCVKVGSYVGGVFTTRVEKGSAIYSDALPLAANPIQLNIGGTNLRQLHRVGNTVIR